MSAVAIGSSLPMSPRRFNDVRFFLPWGGPYFSDASLAQNVSANTSTVRVAMGRVGGFAHDFTATGEVTSPTIYRSSTERPCLSFNGSQWLYGGENNNLSTYPNLWRGGTGPSDLASFANFAYARPSTVSSVITLASRWQTSGTTGGWWVHHSSAANKWQAFFRTENVASGGGADVQLDSANAATVNTWHLIMWGYDHAARSYWLKINDETTVSTTSAYQLGRPGAPCRIGTRATTNETTLINLWNGRIGMMGSVARASFTAEEVAVINSFGPTL